MMNNYRVIQKKNERELTESIIVENLLGYVAVGRPIVDGDVVIQVTRKVRDGYVTADGQPCDGKGKILNP